MLDGDTNSFLFCAIFQAMYKVISLRSDYEPHCELDSQPDYKVFNLSSGYFQLLAVLVLYFMFLFCLFVFK